LPYNTDDILKEVQFSKSLNTIQLRISEFVIFLFTDNVFF